MSQFVVSGGQNTGVGYVSLNFCLINEDYSLLLFSFLFVYINLCLLTGSLLLEYVACNILTF